MNNSSVVKLKGRKPQRKNGQVCTFCKNSQGYNRFPLAGGWIYLCACCKKELELTNKVISP